MIHMNNIEDITYEAKAKTHQYFAQICDAEMLDKTCYVPWSWTNPPAESSESNETERRCVNFNKNAWLWYIFIQNFHTLKISSQACTWVTQSSSIDWQNKN